MSFIVAIKKRFLYHYFVVYLDIQNHHKNLDFAMNELENSEFYHSAKDLLKTCRVFRLYSRFSFRFRKDEFGNLAHYFNHCGIVQYRRCGGKPHSLNKLIYWCRVYTNPGHFITPLSHLFIYVSNKNGPTKWVCINFPPVYDSERYKSFVEYVKDKIKTARLENSKAIQ